MTINSTYSLQPPITAMRPACPLYLLYESGGTILLTAPSRAWLSVLLLIWQYFSIPESVNQN